MLRICTWELQFLQNRLLRQIGQPVTYFYTHLPVCLPACLLAYLLVYLSVCLPVCLTLSAYLTVCLPVFLSLPACLPACLPAYLPAVYYNNINQKRTIKQRYSKVATKVASQSCANSSLLRCVACRKHVMCITLYLIASRHLHCIYRVLH